MIVISIKFNIDNSNIILDDLQSKATKAQTDI